MSIPDAGWRGYQRHMKLREEKSRTFKRIPRYALCLIVLVLLVQGSFSLLEWMALRPGNETEPVIPETERLDRPQLQNIVDSYPFHKLRESQFELPLGTKNYHVLTSLDPDLQTSLIDSLDTKWAQAIAIVALDPDTGRILAMASHDNRDSDVNNCLRAESPAASLFKIITAAAAVESFGYTENTRLAFNGNKYTLYKSQLTDKKNKYTNYTNLMNAFADSINPVFGKMGRDLLGRTSLEEYADAFGFNKTIDFDLYMEDSILEISDQPYNWAEIACGFNRVTRISPLHGAMIAGAIINEGKIMTPSIVDTMTLDDDTVYRRKAAPLAEAVKPSTAGRLEKLMEATVTQGTARGAFRNRKNDPILSKLKIGGKTGSINNNPEHIKYDWFAGFAEDKQSGKKIAACVFVAHQEYIGTRAANYFRILVSQYFRQLMDTSRTAS